MNSTTLKQANISSDTNPFYGAALSSLNKGLIAGEMKSGIERKKNSNDNESETIGIKHDNPTSSLYTKIINRVVQNGSNKEGKDRANDMGKRVFHMMNRTYAGGSGGITG